MCDVKYAMHRTNIQQPRAERAKENKIDEKRKEELKRIIIHKQMCLCVCVQSAVCRARVQQWDKLERGSAGAKHRVHNHSVAFGMQKIDLCGAQHVSNEWLWEECLQQGDAWCPWAHLTPESLATKIHWITKKARIREPAVETLIQQHHRHPVHVHKCAAAEAAKRWRPQATGANGKNINSLFENENK